MLEQSSEHQAELTLEHFSSSVFWNIFPVTLPMKHPGLHSCRISAGPLSLTCLAPALALTVLGSVYGTDTGMTPWDTRCWAPGHVAWTWSRGPGSSADGCPSRARRAPRAGMGLCVRTPPSFLFRFLGKLLPGPDARSAEAGERSWDGAPGRGWKAWGRGRTDRRTRRAAARAAAAVFIDLCRCARDTHTPLPGMRVKIESRQGERSRPGLVVVARSPFPVWRDGVS